MLSLGFKYLGSSEHFNKVNKSLTEGYKLDQEVTIIDMFLKHKFSKANSEYLPMADETSMGANLGGDEYLTWNARVATSHELPSHIGSLLGIARRTRPVIAFCSTPHNTNAHAPTRRDVKISKRVARHLAGIAAL